MGGPSSLVYRRGAESATSLAQLVTRDTPLDPPALAPWVMGWPPTETEQTPYRGIRAELVLDARSAAPEPPRSAAEAPAFLRRALDQAVDTALTGVRRAAVMTGGGLDSSVLLGLATRWAERTGGTVFAVSLDFEGPGDDRPHLRALQEHLACEVVRVRPEDAAAHIGVLGTGADAAPAVFPSMSFELAMLTAARENGAERTLSGAGGDELFDGNPHALAGVASRGHPLRALRAARRLSGFGNPRVRAWSWVVRPLLARLQPSSLRAARARRNAPYPAPAWAGPVVRSFLSERRVASAASARRSRGRASDRFAAMRDDDRRVFLAWNRQQQFQLTGVDNWDPYVSLDLSAAIASLRPEYLLYGDQWRGLLRAAASDLLPSSLRERMDKARFEPALKRFIDAAGGLESLAPLSSGRELAALGLVDAKAFRAAFEYFVATPEDGESWMSLWCALAVEAFLRGKLS